MSGTRTGRSARLLLALAAVALVVREPLSLPAASRISLIAETDGSTTAATPRVRLSVLRETLLSR